MPGAAKSATSANVRVSVRVGARNAGRQNRAITGRLFPPSWRMNRDASIVTASSFAGQGSSKMPPPRNLTIGLISDTHGLLRPGAVAALRGSDAIIHAGDIGDAQILAE